MLPHLLMYMAIPNRVAKTHRMPSVAGHFGKRATNYRALLWEITYKDKASYDSTLSHRTLSSQETNTQLLAFGFLFLQSQM